MQHQGKETMPGTKVAITDYTFDSLDIEKSIFEGQGLHLVCQKSGKNTQQLIALVKDADFVITQFAPVDASVIAAMQKCKVIVRYGIGVDNVDLRAAAAKGIPVCNVPDFCTDEVADHTLALILDLTRKITANAIKVKSGGWGLAASVQAMHALKGMTVGVAGFGRIGREVGDRLRSFKCNVLVYDPGVKPSVIEASGFTPLSFDDFLKRSNLITLHCPSCESTQYMINARSIAQMKNGAMLVNTSRGTLVRTEDLLEALQSGKISAAALDVTDPEPLPTDHPLRTMDNVVITSHVASTSSPAVQKLRHDAAHAVIRSFRGQELLNVVNGVKTYDKPATN
jgi:D-3-phosphoglycerate dehydrogenase / 2-oxoglutarate reductase